MPSSCKVIPDNIIDGDKAWLRNVDTEHKMLEHIARGLQNNMDARGKIKLYTDKCREKLIEILTLDECTTIDILKQLNEEEILYASKVFEEIAFNLKSLTYIKCLEEIQKKYFYLDIADTIETAKDFI